MKFLITGGTGLIGNRLTQYLIDKGHSVNILTRNKTLNSLNHFIKYCKQEQLNELMALYSKIPDIPPEKEDKEDKKQTFSVHLNDSNVNITP